MTREQVASALEQELAKLVNAQAGEFAQDRLLSQVINSVGFLQLLVVIEKRLGVAIGDEAIYEAAPVTIGDLTDFLFSLVAQRSSQ
jgi:acyl carrier protein